MHDLLWNKPEECVGFIPQSKGNGYIFGENISKEFCKVNNLYIISRANNTFPLGYAWTNNNKFCIIFSTPNYCYRFANEGSIMEVDEKLSLTLYNFDSAALRGEREIMKKTL